MKTIKIIDLLNKIANGEEVPKKIIFACREYESNDPEVNTHKDKNGKSLFREYYLTKYLLNNEVEIIEEEKEIEKLELFNEEDDDGDNNVYIRNSNADEYQMDNINLMLANKINELIEAVNEMRADNE